MIDLINYNWMPTVADHIIDHSADFYRSAGVSRLHNVDSIDPSTVKENDIIFVKTDEIYNGVFQKNVLPNIKNKFTLISGISSYTVGRNGDQSYLDILNNTNLKYWFCTNPPSVHNDKIIPIPIGFEEIERDGGNQAVLKNQQSLKSRWEDKLDMFYLPFHTASTNPERQRFIDHLKSLDFVYSEKNKLSFIDYLSQLNKFRYTICLEGAGYDTHRNYEALLVNSIPVITPNMVRLFKHYSLPHFIIHDWFATYKPQLDSTNISWDDNFLNIDFHKKRILEYAKN